MFLQNYMANNTGIQKSISVQTLSYIIDLLSSVTARISSV